MQEVVWYKCEDNDTNTTVIDSSHSGYNGTSVNNTSTMTQTGKVNNCFQLNGSTDRITTTQNLSHTIGSPVSLSCWFKLNADGTDSPTSQVLVKVKYFYLYDRLTTNKILFRFSDGISAREVNYTLGTGDRSWHHVVGTFDGDRTSKIYVDGELKDNETFPNPPAITQSTYVWVGESGGTYYDGFIDDVRIYNKTLTQADVDFLYNGGSGTSLLLPVANHVTVGTGTKGTKPLSSRYPVTEGLTAGTTKQTGTGVLEIKDRSLAQGRVYGS